MQTQNPLLDQIARLMTETAGAADGVRREAETVMRGQLQRLIADMDFVTREEFEAVREMAQIARDENDALKARLDALEAKA
ncbi:MAG: accessory factor UbiK family protein [Pseudomonadota bacterium]